jgi:CubicO group peptidase (beta-lactamase class C family)
MTIATFHPEAKPRRRSFVSVWLIVMILLLALLPGCGPSPAELQAVDFTPLVREDWPASTPAEQGLDPESIARLYLDAEEVETIQSLLVVKDGFLIAEKYFHGASVDDTFLIQSVTKSYTSALVGLALREGCISSVDQEAIEFFPELLDRIVDPRKKDITIREMLQMRAGFPWEESSEALFNLLYSGFRPSAFVDVPLVRDPGSGMEYSNLTSHLLGIIVARACDTDLRSFAEEHLFGPLGVQPGEWIQGWEGYYSGHADLRMRARDMAKFGLMYLDGGVFKGVQVVPAGWVRDSLQSYSQDAWPFRIGAHYKDIGYGYQWWSARAGDRRWSFAWGHGGQQIALLEDLDMVIVVTADPLVGEHGDRPWRLERENLNLVADFIANLPGG